MTIYIINVKSNVYLSKFWWSMIIVLSQRTPSHYANTNTLNMCMLHLKSTHYIKSQFAYEIAY